MGRKFSKIRYIFSWRNVRRLYYILIHGIHCGLLDNSMLPNLGKGKYVDVLRKGSFIDICDHDSNETIRLVPFQPNHGVMVEWITSDGQMRARGLLRFSELKKIVATGFENRK